MRFSIIILQETFPEDLKILEQKKVDIFVNL